MAKMYYTLEEVLEKLGTTEDVLKSAVRDGKLREFRDGGTVNYKVTEIDQMLSSDESGGEAAPKKEDIGAILEDQSELSASIGPIELADTGVDVAGTSGGTLNIGDTGINLAGSAAGTDAGGSGSGLTDFGLGPDSSGLDLSLGGDDMVSLDDADSQSDQTTAGKSKEDTVVSSVGVSVFDEEDLDESADPMAKTVMSGTSSGTGLEGVGSGGSGLLDLTRESDDTSLGAELLDEIYPGGDEGATVEMGDATRAGLDAMPDEEEPVTEDAFAPAVSDSVSSSSSAAMAAPRQVEFAPDALSHGAAGLVAVAIVVMVFTGLAVASMVRGTWPSILDFVFAKLWMFGLGAVVAAGAATGLGIFLGKRSES